MTRLDSATEEIRDEDTSVDACHCRRGRDLGRSSLAAATFGPVQRTALAARTRASMGVPGAGRIAAPREPGTEVGRGQHEEVHAQGDRRSPQSAGLVPRGAQACAVDCAEGTWRRARVRLLSSDVGTGTSRVGGPHRVHRRLHRSADARLQGRHAEGLRPDERHREGSLGRGVA